MEQGLHATAVAVCSSLGLVFATYSTGHLRVFDVVARSLLAEAALHSRAVSGLTVLSATCGGESFALVGTVGEDGMMLVTRAVRSEQEERAGEVELEVCRAVRLGTGVPVGVVWATRAGTALDGERGAVLVSMSYDNQYVSMLPLEWMPSSAPVTE